MSLHSLICLIVDDEPLAVQLLSGYVNRTEGLTFGASFNDPIKAIHYLRENKVDLILLDIQMEGLNGLQFVKIVGNETPVILTTAFDQYALDGYALDVVDYLLKPIAYERFLQAVQKVNQRDSSALSKSIDPKTSEPVSYIFVKSGHQHQRVDLQDILYLSGSGDYVTLHLANKQKILTLENLSSFSERLPVVNFCRIHRSHLVALDKIGFIERNRVVIEGEYLPISQSYQEEFWKRIEP